MPRLPFRSTSQQVSHVVKSSLEPAGVTVLPAKSQGWLQPRSSKLPAAAGQQGSVDVLPPLAHAKIAGVFVRAGVRTYSLPIPFGL